jgi:hypothetical protein
VSKAFVAVYTNKCKQYCDQKFFSEIQQLSYPDYSINVADNSSDPTYIDRLKLLCPKASVEHIVVEREPKETLFLRNVCLSANRLRDLFLASNSEYFIIFESDVIPPKNVIEMFEEVINDADIIGGIYYKGFHSENEFNSNNLQYVSHVLSGCTLYKRTVLQKIPFRWSEEEKGKFPDAFISFDAYDKGFRLANYCKIKCQHLHDSKGSRGLHLL